MRRQTRGVLGALVIAVSSMLAGTASAQSYIPFTDYLPPLVFSAEEYESGYNNYCRDDLGHINTYHCVDKVIRQMERRYDDLLDTCDHRGIFALAYLLTTLEYQRASVEPGFFADPEFVNHEDVVFANLYFTAYDNWAGGRLELVPPAWRVAFESAADHSVSTTGNLLLGISAHINRDLPFTLATIGLVNPVTGESRKPDHDKVNMFLDRVAMDAEVQAHWDPEFNSLSEPPVLGAAMLSLIQTWRESAWRFAEQLIAAPTPESQQQVIMDIEHYAYAQAVLIETETRYVLFQSSASRDAFCAAHN